MEISERGNPPEQSYREVLNEKVQDLISGLPPEKKQEILVKLPEILRTQAEELGKNFLSYITKFIEQLLAAQKESLDKETNRLLERLISSHIAEIEKMKVEYTTRTKKMLDPSEN